MSSNNHSVVSGGLPSINFRLKIISTIMSSPGIRTTENDVLLGRGGNNHSHCGNEQLRRIAHDYVGEYIGARKKQKAVISRRILHLIQTMEPPGRFLLYNYSTYEWEVVSDAVAREKVCQALRDAVAIEKEKRDMPSAEQEEHPFAHILDVLSFEQLERNQNPIVTPSSGNPIILTPDTLSGRKKDDCEDKVYHCRGNVSGDRSFKSATPNAEDDYEDEIRHHRGNISDQGSTTPAKRKTGDDCKDEVLQCYRVNVSDDFDLFDGELLRATEDVVLANAAMRKWPNLNAEQ